MKKPDVTKIVYFLRGVGIGIIVTVLILTIYKAGEPVSTMKQPMTKEEIIEKAKEYGLKEPIDTKLDEILPTNKPSESPKVLPSKVPEKSEN